MRIAINVERDGAPRLIEEDIEIAIGKTFGAGAQETFTVTEQDEGCFTCDSTDTGHPNIDALRQTILEDTGTEITIELFAEWNRGY